MLAFPASLLLAEKASPTRSGSPPCAAASWVLGSAHVDALAPLEDPSYVPLHPPVDGLVPPVVLKWGPRSQLRWFPRFADHLTDQPAHFWAQFHCVSLTHQGQHCISCVMDEGDGYYPMDLDGDCCCYARCRAPAEAAAQLPPLTDVRSPASLRRCRCCNTNGHLSQCCEGGRRASGSTTAGPGLQRTQRVTVSSSPAPTGRRDPSGPWPASEPSRPDVARRSRPSGHR